MANLTKRFVIGRLGKPRGLKGELRVFPLTDDVERFRDLKFCYLEDEQENIKQKLEIDKSNIVHSQVFLTFKGINNREAADLLKNHYLSVERSEAIELSQDTYFIADMIGCEVHEESKGYLGKVFQIDKNASTDVVVVKKPKEKDLLYPNLKSIVKNVDLIGRRIDVELPNGLYEIYR